MMDLEWVRGLPLGKEPSAQNDPLTLYVRRQLADPVRERWKIAFDQLNVHQIPYAPLCARSLSSGSTYGLMLGTELFHLL